MKEQRLQHVAEPDGDGDGGEQGAEAAGQRAGELRLRPGVDKGHL